MVFIAVYISAHMSLFSLSFSLFMHFFEYCVHILSLYFILSIIRALIAQIHWAHSPWLSQVNNVSYTLMQSRFFPWLVKFTFGSISCPGGRAVCRDTDEVWPRRTTRNAKLCAMPVTFRLISHGRIQRSGCLLEYVSLQRHLPSVRPSNLLCDCIATSYDTIIVT